MTVRKEGLTPSQTTKQMVGENDRISSFINSLDPGNLPFLDELERQAIEMFFSYRVKYFKF